MSSWRRFFFAPTSVAPMALLRAVWGGLVTIWGLSMLPDVDPFLTEGALRYERTYPAGQWNPLDWTDWTGAPMAACLLLVAAGVGTMLGWRTRLSSAVAVLCLIALQRTNPSIFNSGDLVLRQVGLAVALSPAGLVWSLDARRRRRRGAATASAVPLRAPWAMRLLQLQLCLGYGLSAWAKLRGSTWHEGTALALALRIEDLQRFALPEALFNMSVLLNLMTWGTLVFEAAFGILVWKHRTRAWVLGIGIAFHVAIDLFLDVGFFSYVMIAVYLTWLRPEVAERAVDRLSGRSEPRAARPAASDARIEAEPGPSASAAHPSGP